MKFKTVREGQQAVLYNYMGEGKLLIGPQRVFIFRDRLAMLERKTASQYEYLELKDTVGNVTHLPGPCEMFLNPLELTSLEVKEAIRIDSHYVVVVYKNQGGDVIRRIVEGPTVFIPAADEWIHMFEWHGQDKDEADHMVRAARKITQLPLMPEHFSDKINEVRTLDDTKLVVKIMVYYELVDVLKMLEETADPIADMMNAMCSDVIQFAGKLTFQQFVAESGKLNKTETFPQLAQICEKIGYRLNKIVYRGYTVSIKLQEMHDKNIESRTRMKLQQEMQDMEQKLKDFKVTREHNRITRQNEVADMKEKHAHEKETLVANHLAKLESERHSWKLEKDNLEQKILLDVERTKQQLQEDNMKQLKDLGVDLAKYMKTKQPSNACSELIVVSGSK